MKVQSARCTGIPLEACDEVAVQFYCMQLINLLQQWPGESAETGAYFNDTFSLLWTKISEDSIDYMLIMQKILTKAFAGNVFDITLPAAYEP